MRSVLVWFALATAWLVGCSVPAEMYTPIGAPSGLAYATATAVYTKGVAIADNVPTTGGGVPTAFAVEPALPAGLSLDAATGTIRGTPTALAPVATYTVTASNSFGSTTGTVSITVNDVAPSSLHYSTAVAVYPNGVAIAPNTPSYSGGPVVSFAITPALPAGLSMDTTSGIITGTPTAVTASASFTVTATNSGGSTNVVLSIGVNDGSPANLTYSTNPAVYTKGVAITPNTPSASGGPVVSYSVSPALPAGLLISSTTGIITGTPSIIVGVQNYKVTAMNASGSTSADVTITVNDVAPSNLTYSINPAVYTKGTAIAVNSPSVSGGPVVSYSVNPALPTGLSISTTNGVISGTPSVVAAMATYTVTATNTGGSTTAQLMITVNDIAPTSLGYSTNPAVYTKGVAIANNVPSSGGGAVVSYSVNPALPAGLTLDPASGIISGTPTVVAAQAGYTVTATNSGGNTTKVVTITVNDAAPAGLTYSTNPATYTKGTMITANNPSSSGGAVVSYSVNPALPAGLALSTTTGVITGTPTAVTALGTYTVTATNTGGNTTVMLQITVKDVAPSGLTYSTNPATYAKGTAITPNTPSSSGGAVVSYSVSPALPTGLGLDTTTGVISGTPTVITAQANYTVTATNSGGNTTVMVSIKVTDAPPSNLTYSRNPATFVVAMVGLPNDPLVPSSQGGAVVSYSVSPALPAGLMLDTTSGMIGGMPTVPQLNANYTVTATNSGGSTSVTVSIGVNASGTTGLTANVATGASHSCAIVNGGVQCWGANGVGQLGNGTGVNSSVPVMAIPEGATAVTAGGSHACAIVNGGAMCWGSNVKGQLGNNSTTNSPFPVQVNGLTSGVQAISAGAQHTCAIVNGGVVCWGDNGAGELGDNSNTQRLVPVAVSGLGSGAQSISAGLDFTCAVVNGGARCWGNNASGQLGNGNTTSSAVPVTVAIVVAPFQALTSVRAIATGQSHSCAIVEGGVMCWGDNGASQLGNNSNTNSSTPVNVSGPLQGAQAISAGAFTSCVIENGAVRCWGSNGFGQFGNNTTVDSKVPVSGILGGATAIAVGGTGHMCVLANSAVQCAGLNQTGQLGDNTTTNRIAPVVVVGLTGGIGMVSAGMTHTCTIHNGKVWCWGQNTSGQCGDGSTTNRLVPVQAQNTGFAQQVSTGHFHTCAIINGGAWCWGSNAFGQLGNNTTTDSTAPVQVQGLLTGVQMIAAGREHTCAVQLGAVKCWGRNNVGQLGNGAGPDSKVPVSTTGVSFGVTALAVGWSHTCAVQNGRAYCWGDNTYGQVGNNSATASFNTYQAVTNLTSGVQALSATGDHTCALVNGGAQCWGRNQYGQLGNNSTTQSLVPVAVSGLANGVQQLSAGYTFSCALVQGAVHCWGDNANGQLGTDQVTNSLVPLKIPNFSFVTMISAGGYHAAALATTIWTWGYNLPGMLGINSTTQSKVPVQPWALP